jgi:hypothetical protein
VTIEDIQKLDIGQKVVSSMGLELEVTCVHSAGFYVWVPFLGKEGGNFNINRFEAERWRSL